MGNNFQVLLPSIASWWKATYPQNGLWRKRPGFDSDLFADLSQFFFAQRESQFGFPVRQGRVHQARRNRIIAPGFWSNQNQKSTWSWSLDYVPPKQGVAQ
jgi:hypothetical protein